MSGTPRFHPLFWIDLAERREWYESQQPGLSRRFASVLDAGIELIIAFPRAHKCRQGRVRSALLTPFKDLLIYREQSSDIYILGVVHGSRDIPAWLNERLGEGE